MNETDCCHFRKSFQDTYESILEDFLERKYRSRKSTLFSDVASRIVEIGPGPGTNLKYFPKQSHVIAIEPNPRMHPRLQENARANRIQLEIRSIRGEQIDLEAESVDVVVSTLLLCSVDDPQQVVTEIKRILKPGGVYLFLEHIAAPKGTGMGYVQTIIKAPWKWLFDGCTVNRKTDELLQQSFDDCEFEYFEISPDWLPITYNVIGKAVKDGFL